MPVLDATNSDATSTKAPSDNANTGAQPVSSVVPSMVET